MRTWSVCSALAQELQSAFPSASFHVKGCNLIGCRHVPQTPDGRTFPHLPGKIALDSLHVSQECGDPVHLP